MILVYLVIDDHLGPLFFDLLLLILIDLVIYDVDKVVSQFHSKFGIYIEVIFRDKTVLLLKLVLQLHQNVALVLLCKI